MRFVWEALQKGKMSKHQKKPTITESSTQYNQAKMDVHEAEKKLKNIHLIPKDDKQQYEDIINEVFLMVSSACSKEARYSKAFSVRAKIYYHMGNFQNALFDMAIAMQIDE